MEKIRVVTLYDEATDTQKGFRTGGILRVEGQDVLDAGCIAGRGNG